MCLARTGIFSQTASAWTQKRTLRKVLEVDISKNEQSSFALVSPDKFGLHVWGGKCLIRSNPEYLTQAALANSNSGASGNDGPERQPVADEQADAAPSLEF